MISLKNSIRARLILILTTFLIIFVAINMFMNMFFLERYYTYQKKNVLGDIYKEVCRMSEDTDVKEEYSVLEKYYFMDRLSANNGITLYVFSITSDGLFNYYNFEYPEVDTGSVSFNIVKNRLDGYVNDYYGLHELGKNYQIVSSTYNYDMYKVYDDKIGSNYLELFGKLDKTTFIFLRANYQNMKESAAISNQCMSYIGLIIVVIGDIAMFFIGRNFTKPILELSEIADRMAKLDFDAKYNVTRDDEIGRLGTSMNMLSSQLEYTISELKSANNELQSDIERKVQIDEMRQEFLSNVSHELKTPIALIQGYAEGLSDNVIDDVEDRKFYCDVIMDEAKKMNRMVRRLLNLNQLEFGNDKPNMDRFDIVEVIKSVVASSNILFKQKNISLTMYEPAAVYVWADEYLVEEVLTNYVSNALNHVKEPNIIRIYTKKNNGVVRIGISNTGDKIPEEELEKIWIKFYKVDKARTREYGGNGIGLSIVKAIMRSFNHECGVINLDDGVEFWFELDSAG